jgi:hypothetical protein
MRPTVRQAPMRRGLPPVLRRPMFLQTNPLALLIGGTYLIRDSLDSFDKSSNENQYIDNNSKVNDWNNNEHCFGND